MLAAERATSHLCSLSSSSRTDVRVGFFSGARRRVYFCVSGIQRFRCFSHSVQSAYQFAEILKFTDATVRRANQVLPTIESKCEIANIARRLSMARTMLAASAPANLGLRFDQRQIRTGAGSRRALIARPSN